MLVVPHAHDQPDNAFRAERLGVARVIEADRYRAARVKEPLQALLTRSSYRDSAHAVAEVIRAEHGAQTAADTITAHASRIASVS